MICKHLSSCHINTFHLPSSYAVLCKQTPAVICVNKQIFSSSSSIFFQIVDIPKKTFPKLYELHTIDFSYNNISQIGKGVFTNLLSLRQLNFTHNHLVEIESSTFGNTVLTIDLGPCVWRASRALGT
jgi:Leucine-rich repeat (LRR) protein